MSNPSPNINSLFPLKLTFWRASGRSMAELTSKDFPLALYVSKNWTVQWVVSSRLPPRLVSNHLRYNLKNLTQMAWWKSVVGRESPMNVPFVYALKKFKIRRSNLNSRINWCSRWFAKNVTIGKTCGFVWPVGTSGAVATSKGTQWIILSKRGTPTPSNCHLNAFGTTMATTTCIGWSEPPGF